MRTIMSAHFIFCAIPTKAGFTTCIIIRSPVRLYAGGTGRRRSQLLAQRLSGGGKRLFRLYRPFGRLQDFSRFCAARHGRRQTAAVETLSRLRHPYELNTSGWTKCGEQHPYGWMLEELNKSGVPVVISDDAHDVDHLARHFERAEELLAKMNYTNRWRLKR